MLMRLLAVLLSSLHTGQSHTRPAMVVRAAWLRGLLWVTRKYDRLHMRASRRAGRRTRPNAPHRTASGLLMEELVRDIVAVLLGVEHPPPRMERLWGLGAQDALHRWVSIRDVDAGNLVIAVILETVARDGAEGRVHGS